MVAIFYQSEAYSTSQPRLMGRNAAGESFLRGYFEQTKDREFWVIAREIEDARVFAQTGRAVGRSEKVNFVGPDSIAALREPGMVYFPGPGIGEHAFQRATFGHAAWSLCGVTHTTSSARAMDALAELISAPVQDWDALICTSKSVKANVLNILQAQVDYLKDRLGITKVVLPKMPIIPLGIHTKDFVFSDEDRATARARLNVGADTLVVLFMGRLSFHAKAHPLAMYQALEAAKHRTGKDVVLIECGWHANPYVEKAYAEAARVACPSVRVVNLDGRKAEDRASAWASADIFCSLSDNIQETFGLVPIEAMAAGLPVVVSDWDGYRESVRDGIDGFLIPTSLPPSGFGNDLALRHAFEVDTYDMYCGHTCSLVSVSVDAAINAFENLFNSSDLRKTIGAAGRLRSQQTYDWSVIIPQYEALWAELGEIRAKQTYGAPQLKHPWPARQDPFHAFSHYSTSTLIGETKLSLVDEGVEASWRRLMSYRELAMVNFARYIIPSDDELRSVLEIAAAGSMRADELLAKISNDRRAIVFRALSWLQKLNILRVA